MTSSSPAPSPALLPIATLPLADGGVAELLELVAPLDQETSAPIAHALAAMDPWRRYRFSADRLQRFIAEPQPHAPRYLVRTDSRIVGVVVLKPGWMFGSYLNFLAVLAPAQGRGVGGAVLDWMRADGVRRGERNQFVVTSAFNDRALGFYQRHGFEVIAEMPGLIDDAEIEILMRRRLA